MKNLELSKQKIIFLLAICSFFYNNTFAQSPPVLGVAQSYTLFTAAGAFENTGASYITGDVGTNVGSFTGIPPGTVVGEIHVADPSTAQAAIDVDVAYSYLSGITCGSVLGTTLGNNQILTPGIYCIGAASTINGDLVLDGQGNSNARFIFKIDGALSTSTFSNVKLINLASLCNVYWQVNGAFTLGDNSVFTGTLINNGAISLLEGSVLLGRGLSRGGAISVHNSKVAEGIIPIAKISSTNSSIFCLGESIVLSVAVTKGIGPFYYLWSPGGQIDSTITVSPAISTLYKVSVRAKNGCSVAIDSMLVTVSNLPFSRADSICQGQSGIVYTVPVIANATSYIWTIPVGANITAGSNTNSITVNFNSDAVSGFISVQGSNSCGKGAISEKYVVTVNPTPVAVVSSNSPVCEGSPITLVAQEVQKGSYQWTNPNGYSSVAQNPVIQSSQMTDAGIYSLVVSSYGCTSSPAIVIVAVNDCNYGFSIPEGFSPNSDGINDVLFVKGIEKYPDNSIVIFNRWGDKVFQENPYQNKWDGHSQFGLTLGGDELPIGSYFYIFDLGDGSTDRKGSIYLNR